MSDYMDVASLMEWHGYSAARIDQYKNYVYDRHKYIMLGLNDEK